MSERTIDPKARLWLGYDAFILRQVPFALGLGVLGLVAITIADTETRSGSKLVLAGFILIAAALAYCAYAWHRRTTPGGNGVLLAEEGIVYRLSKKQEHFIPWDEVIAIEPADRSRIPTFSRGPRIAPGAVAIVVSKSFYDRHIHVEWMIMRGPYWHLFFIDQGERVQLVLHHDIMSITPGALRAELFARWRAFSRHPNARLQPTPWPEPVHWLPPEARQALARLAPSRGVRRIMIAALAVAMLPAIYHWHWFAVRLTDGVPPEGSREYYLRDLIDKAGVPACVSGGAVRTIQRAEVAYASTPSCTRTVRRSATTSRWLPAYEADIWCMAELRLKPAAPAVAVFELAVETHSWGFDPKRQHTLRVYVPKAPAPEVARAKLATFGTCREK